MTWQQLLSHCLAKPGAWQDEPWEGDIVVKVGPKIFAFLGSGASVGLKCGPTREAANEWLLRYPDDASVMAYIGRSGWNNLRIGGLIPDDELLEAVDASYQAVISKLPKRTDPSSSEPAASQRARPSHKRISPPAPRILSVLVGAYSLVTECWFRTHAWLPKAAMANGWSR